MTSMWHGGATGSNVVARTAFASTQEVHMPWTTKLLVVANRTADSAELFQALSDRAARGPLKVTLLVPQDVVAGRASRLNHALERLHAAGIEAEAMLGDVDPVIAVQEAWDPRQFDEILVATLPAGVSHWLSIDLPQRIGRCTGAPVSHIVASEGALSPA
jgi:hypothetical protein